MSSFTTSYQTSHFCSPSYVYLDRLICSHHHSTSLQNQLNCGFLFSSANRALNTLNSTFRPAFSDASLASKIQKFNYGFIQSQILLLIDHYHSVLDDALSHLSSLPLHTLTQTLPSVLNSIQKSTKLSTASHQFAHQVIHQLGNSSAYSSPHPRSSADPQLSSDTASSSTIPKLMDLHFVRADCQLVFSKVLSSHRPKHFISTKPTKPSTPATSHLTPPTHSELSFSWLPSTPAASTPHSPSTSSDHAHEPTPVTLHVTSPTDLPAESTDSPPASILFSDPHPKSPTPPTSPKPSTNPTNKQPISPKPVPYFLRPKPNISSFQRQGHSTTSWSLPAVEADTILIGDSNLSRLKNIPTNCHVFSYSGANIDHLHSIISKYSHPNCQPRNILFSVGINNRNQNPTASSIPSLKKLISKTVLTFPKAKIYMATINFSSNLTKLQQLNLKTLNSAICALPTCTAIPPLDSDLFSTGPNNIHWSPSTASHLLTHWLHHLNL